MKQTGKIARLPHTLREELNERLLDNEPAETLLLWLNDQPAAKEILARQFKNSAITLQNLSRWRSTGFAAWQLHGDLLDLVRVLAETSAGEKEFTTNELLDHLTTVLTARYLKLLTAWDGQITKEFNQQVRILHLVCRDLTQLKKLQAVAPPAARPAPRACPTHSSPGLLADQISTSTTTKAIAEPHTESDPDDFDLQELEELKQTASLLRSALVHLKANGKPAPNLPGAGVPVPTAG